MCPADPGPQAGAGGRARRAESQAPHVKAPSQRLARSSRPVSVPEGRARCCVAKVKCAGIGIFIEKIFLKIGLRRKKTAATSVAGSWPRTFAPTLPRAPACRGTRCRQSEGRGNGKPPLHCGIPGFPPRCSLWSLTQNPHRLRARPCLPWSSGCASHHGFFAAPE